MLTPRQRTGNTITNIAARINDELTILLTGLNADMPPVKRLELRNAAARCAFLTRELLTTAKEMQS